MKRISQGDYRGILNMSKVPNPRYMFHPSLELHLKHTNSKVKLLRTQVKKLKNIGYTGHF
jgi:hypothetical protein